MERVCSKLKALLSDAEKMASLSRLMVTRRNEARQAEIDLHPKLEVMRQKTKELKGQVRVRPSPRIEGHLTGSRNCSHVLVIDIKYCIVMSHDLLCFLTDREVDIEEIQGSTREHYGRSESDMKRRHTAATLRSVCHRQLLQFSRFRGRWLAQ